MISGRTSAHPGRPRCPHAAPGPLACPPCSKWVDSARCWRCPSTGGRAGAARALGRPAGDVAGQLSDWERELGLPLVDGDRLTPAGRRLAEHAGTLLGQLESAESDAAAVAGRVAGMLRLGVGADAGRVLLPETLATLRSTDVRLRVRQLADERVGALDSTLDAVVVGEYGAAVPHRPDVEVERRELFTEPLLLAVPGRHRATGASVRLAELAGERVDRRRRRHAGGAGAGRGRRRVRAAGGRRGRRGRASR